MMRARFSAPNALSTISAGSSAEAGGMLSCARVAPLCRALTPAYTASHRIGQSHCCGASEQDRHRVADLPVARVGGATFDTPAKGAPKRVGGEHKPVGEALQPRELANRQRAGNGEVVRCVRFGAKGPRPNA